jgi:hypothetical protein
MSNKKLELFIAIGFATIMGMGLYHIDWTRPSEPIIFKGKKPDAGTRPDPARHHIGHGSATR